MQIARMRSFALLLGLVVLPLAGTTWADPSPTPSGKKRQHGAVFVTKEIDATSSSARTKKSNVVVKKQPVSKPVAAAKATPSPRATPIPKKPAKKN